MIVTRKCNNLTYKPPPHICPVPNASMQKGGGGVIAGFYDIRIPGHLQSALIDKIYRKLRRRYQMNIYVMQRQLAYQTCPLQLYITL